MSTILDVRGLRKSYGARTLLDGVDLHLAEGEKVGVIGRNGSGKSTLFRILAGLEGHDGGTIALRRDVRVGFLPQDPEMDPGARTRDVAAEGLPDGLDEWEKGHRVEAMLSRLGVEDPDRPVGDMSGGERRRVALARTLLQEPDLLLLDEPTNHLDADTVLWLEETLFDFPGAALIVTHDRYFLDRVVDRMLEVTPRGLTSYDGGYTDYLEERAARDERERVEEGKRLRFLEKELAWARRSPPARTGKQKARRGRARELAGEQRKIERQRTGAVEMEMAEAPRLGSRVLELHGVSKAYGDRVILDDFSDRLLKGERVGVVGPNGVGKTTLLRLVVGEEAPDGGEVVLGENTRIGYLDQARELDPELSVERAVSELDRVRFQGREMHLNAYLDRFLFPPEVRGQKVSSLSGGERSRVLLARLLLQDSNLLVLDEPTNDLDLDTLRILEDALEGFPGCILLVTHDRYLLDRLATSLWVLEGEGRVRRHHGSWDAWLTRREEEQAGERARKQEEERRQRDRRAAEGREQAREARSDRQRLTFKEKRELEGLGDRIGELEREKEELGGRLADPEFYQNQEADVAGATRRYREVEEELEAAYQRWMELEEKAS
jgi:ABC transport system ATP-binding/permease protein